MSEPELEHERKLASKAFFFIAAFGILAVLPLKCYTESKIKENEEANRKIEKEASEYIKNVQNKRLNGTKF